MSTGILTALRSLLFSLLTISLLMCGLPIKAEEAPTPNVRLGVLAFRPKPETLARWQALVDYLNQNLPGARVTLEALTYPELEQAVRDKRIDLVLTQPAHYILLTRRDGLLSPLATLSEIEGKAGLAAFGGVIVTRASNNDIHQLSDLRRRRIATSSIESLGSYQMQARELLRQGIHLPEDAQVIATGQPQDRAIIELLADRADVAFVRTGVIEAMVREHKLTLEQIRIINPQIQDKFPYLLSTQLYPEWPIAALPWVNEDVARRIAAAILSMPHDSPTSRAMHIHGFDIPADYRPVDDLLRELRLPPYDTQQKITLQDIIAQFSIPLLIGGTASLLIVSLIALALLRSNQRLKSERSRTASAMASLSAAEARFRTLFESVDTLAIHACQADGTVVYWNHAAELAFGYSATEAIGRPLIQLIIPSAQHEATLHALRWMLTHRTSIPGGKLRRFDKQGNPVDVYANYAVINTVEYGPTLFSLDINITSQVLAEQAFHESERERQRILDTLGEGVFGIDTHGRCTFINPAALALLGFTEEEVLNQDIHSLTHHHRPDGSPYPADECPVRSTTRDARPRHLTETFWRKNGTPFPVRLTIMPNIRDGQILGSVVSFDDISDSVRTAQELEKYRNHLEEQVRQRTQQLEIARKAAETASRTKSAFLANMSHEIRTPLNAVLGMVHLLRRDQLTPAQSNRLDKIDAASQHLLAVINDILDISKIEAGKLVLDEAPVDIEAILKRVVSVLGDPIREKGLALHIEHDDFPEALIGDATRITQCLINYAGNAIKFTEHGSITLRARHAGHHPEGERIRFEVEDTGVGVPPDAINRLFGIFEQADNSTTRRFGGTGLGLAITRRLAELMGGEVGVTSKPGQGSCFWFTAYLKSDHAQHTSLASSLAFMSSSAAQAALAGRHLLVVEDEPINCEITLEILQEFGITADTAGNGKEALDRLAERPYHLVLMDMQMPEMDGLEATRRIRAQIGFRDLPIVAMTANAFAEDRVRCLEAGMNDFLPKPVDPDELKLVLLRYLGR